MKKVLVLTICFTFAGMGSVSAQLELKKHTFELGTEISYIKYEEPDVMEDKGMMYGLVGSYTYHDKVMLKAEGKGSWGEVDYDGELQNETVEKVHFHLARHCERSEAISSSVGEIASSALCASSQ
jgi:hypothetical protein